MGCRERSRGSVLIPGSRPAGILTAGTAQRYINMEGYSVGKKVVILGSGDIGLIMARRLTLEGAQVLACIEIMPFPGGLTRNIVQCLDDYNIPLYLSHTIVDIKGKNRVERVTIAKVDEKRQPIEGSEFEILCDTVLLTVGLIPENELSHDTGIGIDYRTGGSVVNENMQTSVNGIFACGNVVHVHDLVDFVTEESIRAGKAAAQFCTDTDDSGNHIEITCGGGISYTVPQWTNSNFKKDTLEIFFRVNQKYDSSTIMVSSDDTVLACFKREYILPGEMQKISILRKLIQASAKNIKISVREEKQ